jgi:hypothetical protein
VTAGAGLGAQVRSLVDAALDAFAGTPQEASLREARSRLDEPIRVAVAGKVKAGKSTLLNALVGQELAPTDAGECTKVVTWYRDGPTYRATLVPRDHDPRQVPFVRDGGPIEVDLGSFTASDVDRLEIEWPSATLRVMTLIDTPGIASTTAAVSDRTVEFLAPEDDRATPADAVLYLLRHVHGADVRFLEAFHDDEVSQPSPVNAIGVLSRADEVGVARLDAMESAARIARRYQADPTMRRLCQDVIPMAGLLAQGGSTLREDEFRALARLASEPADILEFLVMSADRFARSTQPADPPAAERKALIERLGLFGVRVAITSIRRGEATSAPRLAESLVARSGLHALRAALETQFGARAGVLKARSALNAVEAALRNRAAPQAERLAGELERVEAGAHELAELRLLGALRRSELGLTDEERVEAERLVGSDGSDAWRRLGLSPESEPAELADRASLALSRWARRAEHPMSSRETVEAARILVRTCEGMLAEPSSSEP